MKVTTCSLKRRGEGETPRQPGEGVQGGPKVWEVSWGRAGARKMSHKGTGLRVKWGVMVDLGHSSIYLADI